jgi:hypothetical protein
MPTLQIGPEPRSAPKGLYRHRLGVAATELAEAARMAAERVAAAQAAQRQAAALQDAARQQWFAQWKIGQVWQSFEIYRVYPRLGPHHGEWVVSCMSTMGYTRVGLKPNSPGIGPECECAYDNTEGRNRIFYTAFGRVQLIQCLYTPP